MAAFFKFQLKGLSSFFDILFNFGENFAKLLSDSLAVCDTYSEPNIVENIKHSYKKLTIYSMDVEPIHAFRF